MVKLKTAQSSKTDKIVEKVEQEKKNFFNSQHSFVKFKDISDSKELSLDSLHQKLNDFHKKITMF